MKDFITAALPWIIIGIAIALLAVNAGKRKKGDDNMSEGMCIGMCIGVALGASGVIDLGLGISLGMLAGMAVGSCVKKG